MVLCGINSFIQAVSIAPLPVHSLLIRGAPDTVRILCQSFAPKRHGKIHKRRYIHTVSEGLAQGPYVVARARFEHMMLQMKKTAKHHKSPPHPPQLLYCCNDCYLDLILLAMVYGMIIWCLDRSNWTT